MGEITVRKLSQDDMEEFVRIAKLPQVFKGTGRVLPPDEIFDLLQKKDNSFAITLCGKYIGYISMFDSGLCDWPGFINNVEVSYSLNPEFWGRGYAGEALDLIIRKARNDGIDCMLAGVFPDNDRSLRMLENRKFRYIYSLYDEGREERIMLKVL